MPPALLTAFVVLAAPVEPGLGALPVTSTAFEPRIGADVRPPAGLFHEPGVLFINFDGGQMQDCNGSDWPVDNCSTIMNDLVLPYSGNAASRAAVVQAMANDTADFALVVVGERPPADAEYDMVMVGNWDPAPEGGFAGIAPTIDCWNTSKGETSFSLDFGDAGTVAKIVGQEAAHVWGLEHVDSASDLLFPTIGGAADPSFEDECHQIVVIDGGITPSTANCPEMHAANCDLPDTQNGYRDLLMIFGPPGADLVPPTLEILAPLEGEAFASGTDFELVIRMIDDVPPQLFEVYASIDVDAVGDQLGNPQWGPELTLPVDGLPDGEHFIRIDIADQQGNPATATVSFVIGVAPGDTGGGGSGGSSGAADSGGHDGGSEHAPAAGSTGEGEGTDGPAPGDAGANGEADDGCGCRADGGSRPLGWVWTLVVFTPARRRRRWARGFVVS